MAKTVLDSTGIAAALERIATSLCAKTDDAPFAVVGIRRGGEPLARRLAKLIGEKTGTEPPIGMVDITLYRDDGFGPHDWPTVGTTRIEFDLPRHTIVLVDDVLFTGRTVRSAVEAILDYGRPKAIRLAVLVDRGLHELPIAADAVGLALTTKHDEHVTVHLVETNAKEDIVVVEPAAVPASAQQSRGSGRPHA